MWRVGVDIYASSKMHIPPIELSDADLLIAATAIAVERVLLTCDEKLCRNLQELGYSDHVRLGVKAMMTPADVLSCAGCNCPAPGPMPRL